MTEEAVLSEELSTLHLAEGNATLEGDTVQNSYECTYLAETVTNEMYSTLSSAEVVELVSIELPYPDPQVGEVVTLAEIDESAELTLPIPSLCAIDRPIIIPETVTLACEEESEVV